MKPGDVVSVGHVWDSHLPDYVILWSELPFGGGGFRFVEGNVGTIIAVVRKPETMGHDVEEEYVLVLTGQRYGWTRPRFLTLDG